jgi:transposase-like protein
MPPHNRSIEDVAREEGISVASLYLWRKQARAQGRLLPAAVDSPEGWSAREKFAAVVECAALNETELAEYCRSRGLYPEQIRAWRAACEHKPMIGRRRVSASATRRTATAPVG